MSIERSCNSQVCKRSPVCTLAIRAGEQHFGHRDQAWLPNHLLRSIEAECSWWSDSTRAAANSYLVPGWWGVVVQDGMLRACCSLRCWAEGRSEVFPFCPLRLNLIQQFNRAGPCQGIHIMMASKSTSLTAKMLGRSFSLGFGTFLGSHGQNTFGPALCITDIITAMPSMCVPHIIARLHELEECWACSCYDY